MRCIEKLPRKVLSQRCSPSEALAANCKTEKIPISKMAKTEVKTKAIQRVSAKGN
jgi:hypothetical protein